MVGEGKSCVVMIFGPIFINSVSSTSTDVNYLYVEKHQASLTDVFLMLDQFNGDCT